MRNNIDVCIGCLHNPYNPVFVSFKLLTLSYGWIYMYSPFRITDKENGFNIVSPNWTIVKIKVSKAKIHKTMLSTLGLVNTTVSSLETGFT